ncbi:MAG: M23 family metallopeptidase [Anaerolineae bacterium]|nr:M23 family metallopeptidase [Anaerolineae bacterium]
MGESSEPKPARVVRNVNIRRTPTTEGNTPVGLYTAGDAITVYETRQINGDAWVRTIYQDAPAWAAMRWSGITFIEFTEPLPDSGRARVLRNVNIRREPSTQGNTPVGFYTAGDEFVVEEVCEVGGDVWVRTAYRGAPAWVAMQWHGVTFLEWVEEAPPPPPPPPPPDDTEPVTARVINGVNVRRVPTTQDNIPLGSYPAGAEIAVYDLRAEAMDLWARVYYAGQPAWAAVEWRGAKFVEFPDPAGEARLRARFTLSIRKALLVETAARIYPPGSAEYTRSAELIEAARPVDLGGLGEDIAGQAMPEGYKRFWALQTHLGLPDPFTTLPVPLDAQYRTFYHGFGPNTFALNNWRQWYRYTAGMHSGVDYSVPTGSPLYALADGVVENIRFLSNPNEVSLVIRCLMPARFDRAGRRVLSNVRLAYGHLATGRGAGSRPLSNLRVGPGDVVRAGQYVADSGYPVSGSLPNLVHQTGNAHLHFEIHLVEHDGSAAHLMSRPLNPLLFFAPEVAMQQILIGDRNLDFPYPAPQTLAGRGLGFLPLLDYWTLGMFRYGATPIWQYQGTRANPWPPGVLGLDELADEAAGWQAYEGKVL